MTTANADKFLISTLSGDATLMALVQGIYSDHAGKNATYPLIVYQQIGPSEPAANAYGDSIFDVEPWQVAVVGTGESYVALETAADRVRALLHKSSGAGVLGCIYTSTQRLAERIGGVEYRNIILEFEIYTQ